MAEKLGGLKHKESERGAHSGKVALALGSSFSRAFGCGS